MIKRFNIVKTCPVEEVCIVDFKVMGLSSYDSDFLNWCMANKDNLEFLKEKQVLELQSASSILYFNDSKTIERIDKTSVEKRTT